MTEGVSWRGWGNPEDAVTLDPELRSLLSSALGVRRPTPAIPLDQVRLPKRRLSTAALRRLGAVVGDEHVHCDRLSRIRHTRGKSTADLLRIRAGDASDAPDAVLAPGSHEEVQRLLQVCAAERLALVPYGGGTSVVGGLAPDREHVRGAVALDLHRLDRLLELDEFSRTATLEAGLRGPAAEQLLRAHGYTIGHRPQSFHFASIGGFAATRSSGEASAGYGRFDERVVGLRVAAPRGTIELGLAPKSAAGPDLRELFLGSEGAFGVITAVRVEIRPLPEVSVYEGWRLASFGAGIDALRRLAQDGPTPTVLRLADEAETALDLAAPTGDVGPRPEPPRGHVGPRSEPPGGDAGPPLQPSRGDAEPPPQPSAGCLAITGYEGGAKLVAQRRECVGALFGRLGAQRDDQRAEGWLRDRYRTPYLRDALLDAGALVETLETATFWSNLQGLYDQVRGALVQTLTGLGTPPVVLCHVSHVYRSGASLYFTVAAAQLDDPLAQWHAAKSAASDAIVAGGGTITHHHGVGADHREHHARQLGPLATEILRAIKDEVDPAGILNPGVLVPADRSAR